MANVSQTLLVQEVHGRGTQFYLVVTGGGSEAISTLLTTAGASRSVLAAAVPYASQALVEFLGGAPDEFCSPATARAMAMSAYLKACRFAPEARCCGVACTASLASDRPKRGPHRVHLAYQTADTTAAASLELLKAGRDRAAEERLAAALLLNLVAEACGAAGRLDLPLLEGEAPCTARSVAPPAYQALLAGTTRAVHAPDKPLAPLPRAVFPGAFHPLHAGHRQMAACAEQWLGQPVDFEISIENVDKLPLDFMEIESRVAQFVPEQSVWLTRAPRFSEKADLFPGATFVVGADTIDRIGQARYYGGQQAAAHAAIEHLARRGCRFLVFARKVDGALRSLGDLQLPPALARLCREVPPATFRDDISSTQLRQAAARQGKSPP